MKIIVLSITPYKEKDAIINAISERGDLTFLARGILDPKNKNSSLNNILSTADIELSEGNYKHPVLKACTNATNPMKINNDYDYLSSLLFIAESTKVLLQDEEKELIFNSLIKAVHALKTASQPWEILLCYTANLLKVGGYEFEVNQCVFCGSKKDIITFSFRDGGFVCRNCVNQDTEKDLSKEQMLLIRAAFNNQNIENITFKCTKEDGIYVFHKFDEFISDSFGVNLKSSKLI